MASDTHGYAVTPHRSDTGNQCVGEQLNAPNADSHSFGNPSAREGAECTQMMLRYKQAARTIVATFGYR